MRLLFILLFITCILVHTVTSEDASDSATNKNSNNAIANDVKTQEFLGWTKAHDIYMHPSVRITEPTNSKGRGLIVDQNVSKNTLLLSIPFTILLNIEHALMSDIAEMIEEYTDTEAMAIFIAWQRKYKQELLSDNFSNTSVNIRYLTYLNYISVPETPLFYDEEYMSELKGTALHYYANTRVQAANNSYHNKFTTNITSIISFDDYKNALAITWSRLYSVRVLDRSENKWVSAGCLVPVADFFNTDVSERINIECATNENSTHFQCFSSTNIEAGNELLAPYSHSMSNTEYLNDYAFALNNNFNNDVVNILMPMLTKFEYDTDLTIETKLGLLEKLQRTENTRFSVRHYKLNNLYHKNNENENSNKDNIPISNLLPADLWAYARIIALDTNDIRQIKPKDIYTKLTKLQHINSANDLRAVKYLLNNFNYIIENLYPTRLEYDIALLNEIQHNIDNNINYDHKLYSILLVRIGEKQLLNKIINVLADFKEKLEEEIRENKKEYAHVEKNKPKKEAVWDKLEL